MNPVDAGGRPGETGAGVAERGADISPEAMELIGLADVCELTARLFSFPDAALARALADGDLASDALGCLVDARVSPEQAELACSGLAGLEAVEEDADGEEALLDRLHKGYSVLFLAPGGSTPVWPYESAFLHAESGKGGIPGLFRTPVAMDVESMMCQAGVQLRDSRTTPPDSIWGELMYLSYLFGKAAQEASRGEVPSLWTRRAAAFITRHLGAWGGRFMEKVEAESVRATYGAEYRAFAQVGAAAVDRVRAWCRDLPKTAPDRPWGRR